MKFRYNCIVKFHFPKSESAIVTKAALLPELDSGHNARSTTVIKVNKNILSLNIKANDAVALRASLNSVLKLIGVIQKVLEVE